MKAGSQKAQQLKQKHQTPSVEHSNTPDNAPPNLDALTAQDIVKLQSTIGNQAVQRLVAGHDVVQRSALSSPTRSAAYNVNVAESSGGEQLPEDVQERMETAFDSDFSNVQVHQDGQAENLGAYAFAHGNDIHFAQGMYNPESASGQQVIGHELAHVVQQREGRVSAPGTSSGTSLVDDLSLEAEAHSLGAKAANTAKSNQADGQEKRRAGSVERPVVQGWIPQALAGIGKALASQSAANAATAVGAIVGTLGVAATAGAAIMPGQTGVQEVQLPNGWMSERDKQSLQLIAQYRIVNAYLQRISARQATQGASPDPANPPLLGPLGPGNDYDMGSGNNFGLGPLLDPPAQTPPAAQTGPGTEQERAQLDSTLMDAIKIDVQREIENELNANTQQAENREFIWSDSGDHSADWFGTVGAIQFASMRGTFIRQTLTLSSIASEIPDLILPAAGQDIIVKQFRGGTLVRSPEMETGLNDDLGINLAGGEPTYQQSGDNGHGVHLYDTAWNWDDNTTRWRFEISINDAGMPMVKDAGTEGTPED
jgi:hypothetical protein